MLRIIVPFYAELEAVKPGLRALESSGILFQFTPIQGVYVDKNRNHGVNAGRSQKIHQAALEGFTHFLFIDSDVSFNPGHVRLALAHAAPVLALPYVEHFGARNYQAGELKPALPLLDYLYPQTTRGMKHVTFAGGGFLLVERDVFTALPYPWFRRGVVEVADCAEVVGEDYAFCDACRTANIPILCDFDHPVSHRPRKAEDFNVRY